ETIQSPAKHDEPGAPKRTFVDRFPYVRLVPGPDSCAATKNRCLFDHLVGAKFVARMSAANAGRSCRVTRTPDFAALIRATSLYRRIRVRRRFVASPHGWPPKKPLASRRICERMNGSGSRPMTMDPGWPHVVQHAVLPLFRGRPRTLARCSAYPRCCLVG